jgi:hypothetical protein
MKSIVTIVAALLVLGTAQAGEVFVTKDSQGRPIYTDRPDSLPAERLKVANKSTDTVEVQKRYDEQMKGYAASGKPASEAIPNTAEGRKAKALTAADKAKRCQDSRQRYDHYMTAQRLYEQAPTGDDRRYLDDKEIDAARANAKQVMDEFCAGL